MYSPLYSFSSGHAFFKSCPESRNGKNCTTTKVLQSEIGSNVMFDTSLGHRNGGSCGVKQRIAEVELWKVLEGKVLKLYRCRVMSSYCPNSTRISISYHSKDKSYFLLNLINVKDSDAGEYEARIRLMDYHNIVTHSVTITRMFQLMVKIGKSCLTILIDILMYKYNIYHLFLPRNLPIAYNK